MVKKIQGENTFEGDVSTVSLSPNRKLEYDTENEIVDKWAIQFGEMLFPAFNSLTPKLFEAIFLSKQISESHRGIQGIVDVTWNCLSFSFHKEVFPNLVKEAIESQKYGILATNDMGIFDKPFETDKIEREEKFIPIRLDFRAKTSTFKQKIKEIGKNIKYSDHLKNARLGGISLPIYEVFNDIAVSDAIVNELIDLLYPQKDESDNQENMINTISDSTQNKLKNSRMKKSLQKPLVKEEVEVRLTVKRKDKISLKFKALSWFLINILSSSTVPVVKSLKILVKICEEFDDEDFDNLVNLFMELNALPLLVLNLLSENLFPLSLSILVDLIMRCTESEKIWKVLINESLFDIIKIVSVKYSKNREHFNEILIILDRINDNNPIKVKDFWSSDYREFLNNELTRERETEDKCQDDFIAESLSKILDSVNS